MEQSIEQSNEAMKTSPTTQSGEEHQNAANEVNVYNECHLHSDEVEGENFEESMELVEFTGGVTVNVDTGHLFVTDMVFKPEVEAISWLENVGRRVGVVLVRGRSDFSKGRNPYIKLVCERGGDDRPNHRAKSCPSSSTGRKKLKTRTSTTKKCGCQFLVILKKDKKNDTWSITVRNGIHNHSFNSDDAGHAFKGRLKSDEKDLVARLTKTSVLPKVIRKELKELNPLNTTASQTIYNEMVKLKKLLREDRTVMQEVFHKAETDSSGVFLRYTRGEENQIHSLFLAHKNSLVLARLFPLVLLIDCTYKTNFYKLPLIHVVGVTSTNLTFTIANAYMWDEKKENYVWVLWQLREAITQCQGFVPKAIVTDRELALMDAVRIVFPEATNLLCRWHIQKVVKAKVRPGLKDGECKKIMKSWNNVVWSETEEDYNAAVEGMKTLVKNDIFRYLYSTWLSKYNERFVSFWTNKFFHLGNTETGRVESAHGCLKNWLGTANCDMATGWEAVKSLCDSQWSNVIESFELSRTKWPTNKFKDNCYRYLHDNFYIHALELLKNEVDRCKVVGESVEMCGCVLRQTHGLPCSHELSTILKSSEYISRTAIHEHWRTLSVEGHPCEDDVDPNPYIDDFRVAFDSAKTSFAKLEYIQRLREATLPSCTSLSQPPIKLNPRGRPTKRKSNWKDERSTKRMPSLFEFVEEAAVKSEAEADAYAACQKRLQTELVDRKDFDRNVIHVHAKFREFVADIQDVVADGNCGYRSLAVALGQPEEDYSLIRKELVEELKSNVDHYDTLFRLKGHAKHVIKGVDWKHARCTSKYWMETPTMLWPIAERYNAAVVLFSEGSADGSNLTCFLTRQPPRNLPPIVICVLLTKKHYLCVKLKEDRPLPALISSWKKLSSNESTEDWMKLFSSRLEAGRVLLGMTNVEDDIIEI